MRKLTTLALGLAAAAASLFAQPVAHAAEFELNIGSLAPEGTPWARLMAEIEEDIERESGGRINVIVRPPGLMGEVEMVRETRKGERLQAAGVTFAALAEGGNIPQLGIVELPFLFDSYAEADHVLDNVLLEPVAELMKRRGFVLAVWSENGWRSFGTKGKAVRTPADLEGLKMRSQESDAHMAMYKAFGANAVQKPMTEVLTALQSNVVDGLDNTALYMLTGGLTEPLDYYTMSKHIYQPAVVMYSRRWFEALPEDLQQILMRPRALTDKGRELVRKEDAEMMTLMPQMGVEVIELTDAERDAFKTKARAIHAEFASEIDGGPELLKKIQDSLNNIRK